MSITATIAPNAPTLPLEHLKSKYRSQEYAKPIKNSLWRLVPVHLKQVVRTAKAPHTIASSHHAAESVCRNAVQARLLALALVGCVQ